jgi:hypothetical protein
MDTASTFVTQLSEASTLVQKLWRGYSTRKNRQEPVIPQKKERKGKVQRRDRFSGATLRRVWARSHYEPSTSTYLHNTDFGYLEYDMWEHMNQPPEGETVGLKIRKVRN